MNARTLVADLLLFGGALVLTGCADAGGAGYVPYRSSSTLDDIQQDLQNIKDKQDDLKSQQDDIQRAQQEQERDQEERQWEQQMGWN